VGDIIVGVGFMLFWMTSSSLGAEPTSRFCGSSFVRN